MVEPRILRLLLWQDLSEVLRSARGILFLVFFGIFWFWLFSLLSDGQAKFLGSKEAGFLLNWMFDATFTQTLFVERDPTLSAVFFMALGTAPFFVIIVASDQTATDIGTRYMRFLLPCCQRHEIFIARFFSTYILVVLAWGFVAISAMMLSSIAGTSRPDSLMYSLQIWLSLSLYSLPLVGLMAFFAASVASVGLTVLTGLSTYIILAVLAWYVEAYMGKNLQWFTYILPNAFKAHLLGIQGKDAFTALITMPIYTFVYTSLAWLVFRKRDV